MKLAIHTEQMASWYINIGLKNAFENLGHEVVLWDDSKKSAFDFFNQNKPDILWSQGYNLSRAEIKCINELPNMKVILKVGTWGTINKESDVREYEILMASEEEKEKVASIQNTNRLFLFNYHSPSYNELILGEWQNLGYNIFSMAPVADIYSFYPDYEERYASDIVYCGGYWPYKGKNLNRYILPLCNPVGKYNIKIFGNQHWPVPQYCGYARDETIRKMMSSAKIVPAIHEPQLNRYGMEVQSRVFNAMACKTCVISDYVESLHKDFFPNKEILMFDNPSDYYDAIDYFLKNEDERINYINKLYNIVINEHTFDVRVKQIMNMLLFDKEYHV